MKTSRWDRASTLDGPGAARLPLVVLVAPTTPPIHGQSLVSERAAAMFQQAGHETIWISRNPRTSRLGTRYRTEVLGRLVRAMWISARLRRRAPKTVYVASSGGLGILAEGLCVLLVRSRRDVLIVHHHSFAYLDKYSVVFKCLSRAVYRDAYHVVLCDHMAVALQGYGISPAQVSVVSNAAFVDFAYPHPEPRDPNIHGLRLGHLSNLTIEKGLDVVIDVFEESPEEVTLTIYGAPTDDRSRILLDNALRRNPDRLRHVTPSNREGVWNFFDSVDLFLFPSRYRNEAAPLVILEALATGTPVLATERGCIRSQLSPELEEFVYSEDDFRARAVEVVIALNSDARLRKAVGIRSLRQWRRLEAAADPQKNALLSLVSRY